MPEVVKIHIKQENDHQNIYVIDRGVQSAKTMKDFSKESVSFIIRAKEKRKCVELESFIKEDSTTDLSSLTLVKDSKVYLYTGVPMITKKGTKRWKEELVEVPLRLIVADSKAEPDKQFWFITNDFDLDAQEITDTYRRRWDIEVFFRFIKQELKVSQLVSLNKNGIEVILYMTSIVAMFILIYKNANDIGYKTAKRRFTMEMRYLVISMIIIECGGDPALLQNLEKKSDRNFFRPLVA